MFITPDVIVYKKVSLKEFFTKKPIVMNISFLTVLRDSFTEKSYQRLSEHISISSEQAKNGVYAIIPIILASILENNTASNAVQPIWWNSLKEVPAFTDDKTINVNIINKPFFAVKGRGVSWYMFSFCFNDLVAVVSEMASIQKQNAISLIEITTPLIVCYLINWMEWEGWEFEDLIDNLLHAKYEITTALPVGISTAHLGIIGQFFG